VHEWIRVAVGCALGVVAFDAIAALLSREAGFDYDYAGLGSLLLYAATGYLAARGRTTRRLEAAAGAGFVVGAVDATLGWAIAWAIGPGRIEELTPALWFITAAMTGALALGVAVLGGVIAGRRARAAERSAAERGAT
jgi:hypothetical protein